MKNIYIALLRGINVSGQKKIKMVDLKLHFEAIGFTDVRTYIQSGNIVFSTTVTDQDTIAKQIADKIRDTYGFEVPVLVTTREYLIKAISKNPFTDSRYHGDQQIYLTFLAYMPSNDNMKRLEGVNYPSEEYHVDGKVIYFFSANGYGRAKMNNNFFESKLKVQATTRNWKTVNKLVELANEN